ncbi:hypothetical protein TNCV_430971 [Trichonephila clavipes]|nr:hypothetical protein TNCV_430971 [Trichonephila clavipes]
MVANIIKMVTNLALLPRFRQIPVESPFKHLPQMEHRVPSLLSSLGQVNNGAAMLNGVIHSNDYEGRRVTSCIEVLSTTPHSALDSNDVVKSWKEKLL